MKKIKIIAIGNMAKGVISKMIQLRLDEFDYIEISTWRSDINNLIYKFNQNHKHLKEKIKLSTFLLGEITGKGVLWRNSTDTKIYDLAYKESETKLNQFLSNELINTDIVVIITSLTNPISINVVPQIVRTIKNMGITTVGISIKAFSFEPNKTLKNFESAISNFKEVVDKFILVNTDDLYEKSLPQYFEKLEDRIVSVITNTKFNKKEIGDE